MTRRGFRTILAYHDDFLIIGDTKHECELAYYELIKLLTDLSFSINWEKAIAPTQRLTFLGIEIYTVLRQLCPRESKLSELRQLLSDTLLKRSITKYELQSLAGKLNFAAGVVPGGRTFLRRLIDVANALLRPHHHVRINTHLRADLSWWVSYLSVFNGKTFFVDSTPIALEEFSTDAYSIGGGGFFRGDWFYTNWAIDHPDPDNHTTISALNKVATPALCMQCLRSIFWLSATKSFRITARYIPLKANTVADAISRLHESATGTFLRIPYRIR